MRFNIVLNEVILLPNQLVYEIVEQLGGIDEASTELLFKPVCDLNTISDWVYLDDSFGDAGAIRAYEHHEHVVIALQQQNIKTLELDIYLGDLGLTQDNLYSILLLCQHLQSLQITFYINPNRLDALQALLSKHFPSNKNLSVHFKTDELFSNSKPGTSFDAKKRALLSKKGLFFDQLMTSNVEALHGQLINYSWSCLKAGSAELGCRALEVALSRLKTDSIIRDTLVMQLTVIRFLAHYHLLVANEFSCEQFSHLTTSQIEHLYFIKAFSATLIKHRDDAATWYKKANISCMTPITDEDSLYKLNLYALFLCLKGEFDEAMCLEKKLLTHIQTQCTPQPIIEHVILMNIARLHKKQRLYDKADYFYNCAYQQLKGDKFTIFDKINQEMDKAILLEAQGLSCDALAMWLNVAGSWLSCERPLTMPTRTRQVLCQEHVVDTIYPLSCEKINDFLYKKLYRLYSALALSFMLEMSPRPITRELNVHDGVLLSEHTS